MAFLLSGPGIAVLTIGPAGSSGKNGCSPPEGGEDFTAAAAAYDRCGRKEDFGVTRVAMGRNRTAARSEAIVKIEGR